MGFRPRKCVTVVLVVACLWCAIYFLTRNYEYRPTFESDSLASDLREDCQFLEDPVSGKEGEVMTKAVVPRAVIIVFRHGDRSTLYGDFEVPSMDCSAFRDSDRRTFIDYATLISSKVLSKFITADEAFHQYSRLPHPSRCVKGNLTAEGALQHLRLGNFLRQRYTHNNFFTSTGSTWDVAVYASKYERTFQSVVAFISSFLYPLNNLFPSIHILASQNQQFCDSVTCRCKNLLKATELYETVATRTAYFEKIVGKQAAEAYYKLVDVLQIQNLKEPLHFLDVIRGRYICRRLPLPCHDKTCIKYSDIKQLASLVSIRDFAMFNDTTGPRPSLFRILMVAQSIAILQSVDATVKKLKKSSNVKFLRIYSGHDITLRPLLFTLGLKHREPPHYAARLIVEVYEVKDPSTVGSSCYFRLLYNGEDRTKDVFFCSSALYNNLCSVEALENFVNRQLFSIVGTNSLNELCDLRI